MHSCQVNTRTGERLVGGRLGVLEPVRLVADEEVAAALATRGEVPDVPAERLLKVSVCIIGGSEKERKAVHGWVWACLCCMFVRTS